MRVCTLCLEVFNEKQLGGFGRATRAIARELVARGVDVDIVVPHRRTGPEEAEYMLDGIRVIQFPMKRFWESVQTYRDCDADVYHSQDPMLGTWLAMKAMPDRPHMVTLRDPMLIGDIWTEFKHANPPRIRILKAMLYIDNFLVRRAVHRADALNVPANFLKAKVMRKYGLKQEPDFMPTPYEMPQSIQKAERPTVLFVGRLDARKRPEIFFELAKKFPDVDFVAVGSTRDEDRRKELWDAYSNIPNLEMTGAIDQFSSDRLQRIYEKSWIMVNPAAREGLPETFIEAAAQKCAILSLSDPDGFASKFGYYAKGDDGLETGLRYLLESDRWREPGERGHEYVESAYSTEVAVNMHIEAYERIIDARRGRTRHAVQAAPSPKPL